MGVGDVGGSGLRTDSTGTGGILVGWPFSRCRSVSLSSLSHVSLSQILRFRRLLSARGQQSGGRCGSLALTEQREGYVSRPFALFGDARSPTRSLAARDTCAGPDFEGEDHLYVRLLLFNLFKEH